MRCIAMHALNDIEDITWIDKDTNCIFECFQDTICNHIHFKEII